MFLFGAATVLYAYRDVWVSLLRSLHGFNGLFCNQVAVDTQDVSAFGFHAVLRTALYVDSLTLLRFSSRIKIHEWCFVICTLAVVDLRTNASADCSQCFHKGCSLSAQSVVAADALYARSFRIAESI